ncbi:MAG: BTAD domain-containing putative transcriptional regulator [Jatrophihabitans sp.]
MRGLLAILLMHAGHVVPIDRIIDEMWPSEPPRSAVENIRTYVYQLRSLLGRAGEVEVLESHPGGYRLAIDPEDLDMTRFLRLADEGRHAYRLGQHEAAAVLLDEALALWQGAPLSGLELGRAMQAKAVALDERRWQAEADAMWIRLALGEAGRLIAPLREFTGERPLDEGLWYLLMTALVSSGRTGEGLAAYDQARATFVRELGVEPGPALRRLHASVLRGEEAEPPQRPASGMLPSVAAAPHQLPAATPAFVGRTQALDAISELAQRAAAGAVEHVPLILVSGPPGVGKSATAITAGERIRSLVPDGEIFVDLAGLSDCPQAPAAAIIAILGAFGISRAALPESSDGRRSLYRSLLSGRRVLVVLDNAADIQQVLPLIPGVGRSLVIVTSRRQLIGLPADLRLPLDPLSTGEALDMLNHLVGRDRVDGEPAASSDIVHACGRLPAAIGIAGARLAARPDHPMKILADRLTSEDGVLDELAVSGTSVRDDIESSYRALDPVTQHCFRALGLGDPDSITPADVGPAVKLSHREADRRLECLVHEGLLSTGCTHDGLPLYRMTTLVHRFARERLELEGSGASV